MTFQGASAHYVGAAQLQGDLLSCRAVLPGGPGPHLGLACVVLGSRGLNWLHGLSRR